MQKTPTKVGIIGVGNISGAYFRTNEMFKFFDIVACADIDIERAKAKAEEHGIAKGGSVEELLADDEIEAVINLTIPAAHAPVSRQILEAGKHVYLEKPLAVTREDGLSVLELAKQKGLRVGCAPDTFMGGGLQTCRKLIDDGWIGTPVAATAFMFTRGPESWHANPEFFYKAGGGPMFDMGPYYLTALINMLGPVRRVTGSARISFPERTITSEALYGQKIKVDVPTHIAGVLDFENGTVGTLVTSFDIYKTPLPRIEIYGTEGTLSVPDPNTFRGPVKLRLRGGDEYEVPLTHGYTENSRGIGLADMITAQRSGRAHRASGELAYHVLDLMHAFHDASREERHIHLQSTCERPAMLPLGLREGEMDD
jgi:predicted dehydrogenase